MKARKKLISIAIMVCTIVLVIIVALIYQNRETVSPNVLDGKQSFSANNPIFYADAPDPDVIMVDNSYYMVSTSMHMMPGTPIMKSDDLINWEIIGYPYTRLEDNDAHNLRHGKNIYGQGAWASSLKYFDGKFYVLTAALDSGKTYLFSTEDPSGIWERTEFNEYLHDPTLLFEEDGTAYIIYGVENFSIKQLTSDYKAINYSGLKGEILQSNQPGMEGAHAYKINDHYYITAIWWEKGQIRRQYIYRAENIMGPYEGRLALSDTLDYKQNGVAQGGLVEDKFGQWYAMLFQDHDAVGRIPVLVPVQWEDNWPVYGVDGKVPHQLTMYDEGPIKTKLTISDDFYQAEPIISVVEATSHLTEEEIAEHNIIANGQFNASIADWSGKDGARVTIVEDEGNPVAHIHQRKATYSGIEQNITKHFQSQEQYFASFKVKYSDGPATKDFVLTAKKLIDGEIVYQNLIQATVTKDEWTTLSGSFTINEEVSNIYLFIETPYTAEPSQEDDLMDFYVDNIAVWTKSTLSSNSESVLNDSRLALNWQWNHNPDHTKWSLTERTGYLRLKTGQLSDSILQARNTLTQRGIGPFSSGWIAMDTSAMLNGDFAGIAAFQQQYGFVGVTQENNVQYIVMVEQDEIIEKIELKQPFIYLKVDFDFETDKASFYHSSNGRSWSKIGRELNMKYTIPHFMGYRFALFNYATEQAGGYVDIDFFRFENMLTAEETTHEPYARLKEKSLILDSTSSSEYTINVMLDEPEQMDRVDAIHIELALPKYLKLEKVVPHLPNVQQDTSISTKANDNITTITLDRTNKQHALFENNDQSHVIVSLTLQQVQELTTLQEDQVLVKVVEIITDEGKSYMVNVNGASTNVNFTPLNEAVGKLIGYGNPLVSYKFGADPYALVHDGRVYLYMTHDVIEYGQNDEVKDNSYSTINRLTVISSDDLVNWTDHGEIYVAGPQGAAKWATQSWAPAITSKEIDGKMQFFLYFANNASNIGVLTSDSPLGPWVDPIGKPLISRTDPGVESVTWLFDPAVFVDDDGQGYIYFGGGIPEGEHVMPNTARVAKLGADMVSLDGRAEVIPAPYMFENSGINKVNGLYYYTYCSNFIEGVRGENDPAPGQIAYMVSTSPMGPWEYKGTILKNPGHFFGVGGNNHHAIFEFENQHYIAYHAQTLSKAMGVPKGYRSTHLNKVYFEADGSIREIEANYEGVEATKSLNPYQRVEAETMAWQAGIEIKADEQANNRLVTSIHNGDWIGLRNVNVEAGAIEIVTALKAVTEATTIEIRLGLPDGEKVGEIVLQANAIGETVTEVVTPVSIPAGEHQIFFVFRSASKNELLTFDYWFVK